MAGAARIAWAGRPPAGFGRGSRPVGSYPGGMDAVEEWRGGEWHVRRLTGSAATKAYRCPGCDQEIRPATPHVVVWPLYDLEAGDRRHWHAQCWKARDRRGARVQRSRSAPRY